MPLVDIEQLRKIARPCGIAAFLRRAELLQMQISHAGLVEIGGKLALGEAGPSWCRNRTRVDHEADACLHQLADHGVRPRLLIADGEEASHALPSLLIVVRLYDRDRFQRQPETTVILRNPQLSRRPRVPDLERDFEGAIGLDVLSVTLNTDRGKGFAALEAEADWTASF